MRRRLSWSVLGTLGALAAVVAMMTTGGADVPPKARIIVPQAENTEIAMPRQSAVDIPAVPYAAATTEISTPETVRQPKPKPKPPTTTPPAPPPSPRPTRATPVNPNPWWYGWYFDGGGRYDCHRCR